MLSRAALAGLVCLVTSGFAKSQEALVAAPPSAVATPVPASTVVRIRIDEEISSGRNHRHDHFPLSVVDDVIVDGRVVIPAGTTGEGEVIHVVPGTTGGQPGELTLAARFLRLGDREVRLQALTATGSGKNRVAEAKVVSALANMSPLVFGFASTIRGGEMVITAGTQAEARVAADAPPAEASAGVQSAGDERPATPLFGTVIFFRHSFGGGPIHVIELGRDVGFLGNGTWFAVKAPVGRHDYITKQLDLVTVEVEEGGTYYIAGEISRRAGGSKRLNLRPATVEEFDSVKRKLDEVGR